MGAVGPVDARAEPGLAVKGRMLGVLPEDGRLPYHCSPPPLEKKRIIDETNDGQGSSPQHLLFSLTHSQ